MSQHRVRCSQIGMGYISDTEIVLHYVTGPAFGPAVGTVPLGISPYVKSIVRVAPTGVGGPTGPKGVTYTGCGLRYPNPNPKPTPCRRRTQLLLLSIRLESQAC